MQVLQWMEDAGIHPSNEMYHDISSYSQRCCGAENAAVIKERLGMDIHIGIETLCFLICVCMCLPSFFNATCLLEEVYII